LIGSYWDSHVNNKENNLDTPLDVAIQGLHRYKADYVPIVQFLLIHPRIRINTINDDGHRPIDKAKFYLRRYPDSHNKEQIQTIVTLLEQFVVNQGMTAFCFLHTVIQYKDNIRMG
jgi:hypothetical protein